MDVFVPYDAVDPKSRLSSLFYPEERRALAEAMLTDVLEAIHETEHRPYVLTTAPIDIDATVIIDERPLTTAVNSMLELHEPPLGVVMADLPLVDGAVIERLASAPGDVVLAPGIGGGTNAFVTRDGAFTTDFHGCSIRDHAAIAEEAALEVTYIDSYRLSLDIDEVDDLVEVLLHAEGATHRWLDARDVQLSEDENGRVGITRNASD